MVQLVIRFDAREHLEAVHFGHHHIKQHEIDFLVFQYVKSFAPALRDNSFVTLRTKSKRQEFTARICVVDDKDGSGLDHGRRQRRDVFPTVRVAPLLGGGTGLSVDFSQEPNPSQ